MKKTQEYFANRCLIANHILFDAWHKLLTNQSASVAAYVRCVIAEYQMRHTVPLLELAKDSCLKLNDSKNYIYFSKHSIEENGHHKWGVSDLQNAKKEANHLINKRIAIPTSIKVLIKNQYTAIRTKKIEVFLGYIVALEGFPGNENYWKSFCKENSLSENSFSSAIKHATLDKYHSNELFSHIHKVYDTTQIKEIADYAVESILLISKSFNESNSSCNLP